MDLLKKLRKENIRWFTETDITVVDNGELLNLMRESGCQQVLIGFESPSQSGLDGVELISNWKLKQLDRYKFAIDRIQSHGITVNGCFILGLDGHDTGIFDKVWNGGKDGCETIRCFLNTVKKVTHNQSTILLGINSYFVNSIQIMRLIQRSGLILSSIESSPWNPAQVYVIKTQK